MTQRALTQQQAGNGPREASPPGIARPPAAVAAAGDQGGAYGCALQAAPPQSPGGGPAADGSRWLQLWLLQWHCLRLPAVLRNRSLLLLPPLPPLPSLLLPLPLLLPPLSAPLLPPLLQSLAPHLLAPPCSCWAVAAWPVQGQAAGAGGPASRVGATRMAADALCPVEKKAGPTCCNTHVGSAPV